LIEKDGRITWDDQSLYEGIRQDLGPGQVRSRMVRNLHHGRMGALTKDRGIRPLSANSPYVIPTLGSDSTKDVLVGYDAQFTDAQFIVGIQETSSNPVLYKYVPTNYGSLGEGTWDAKTVTITNSTMDVKPFITMFANRLFIADGTALQSSSSNLSFSTYGDSSYANPSKFGCVYNSRLILSGNATYPYSFFPSEPREANTTNWDGALAMNVTDAGNEKITCVGTCGSWLIVAGRNWMKSYFLGDASPTDWEVEDLSRTVGIVHWSSFKEVIYRGQSFSFFWSEDGPCCVYQSGNAAPRLVSLYEPIQYAVRNATVDEMPGLSVDNFNKVVTAWVPELNEVRFSVMSTDSAKNTINRNDLILCLRFDSLLYYINGDSPLMWRLRDNEYNIQTDSYKSGLPCSTIFNAKVDPVSGLPSATGQDRCFCASNSVVYEMDAPFTYMDHILGGGSGIPIPFSLVRDGYDGSDDDGRPGQYDNKTIRHRTKSIQGAYLSTNQPGDYRIQVFVRSDGAGIRNATNREVDISSGVGTWFDGGMWGDGGKWQGQGSFAQRKGGLGVIGKTFEMELSDNGSIDAEVQLASFSMVGYLEDRI